MYTLCVPGAQEGQRKTTHALGMELQKVGRYHMGSGIDPRSSARAKGACNHWATLQPFLCTNLKNINYSANINYGPNVYKKGDPKLQFLDINLEKTS